MIWAKLDGSTPPIYLYLSLSAFICGSVIFPIHFSHLYYDSYITLYNEYRHTAMSICKGFTGSTLLSYKLRIFYIFTFVGYPTSSHSFGILNCKCNHKTLWNFIADKMHVFSSNIDLFVAVIIACHELKTIYAQYRHIRHVVFYLKGRDLQRRLNHIRKI